MKVKLKQFRARAGMTQLQVAARVGVTQPNYQRWEAGTAPIPKPKLEKLAKVLKTSPDAILARHPPVEVRLYDDSASDDLSYYGEVAIHFHGGGEPLLLSISEDAFARLHHDLQGDPAFVTVKSLANQTVAFRTRAVADVYLSSEAYDDYGPEVGKYSGHLDVQIPDARDWEIIESLACGGDGTEDFAPADVKRVRDMIMITDEQYQELVTEGHIKAEDLEGERRKNEAKTDQIFDLALMTTYQLSTGQKRRVHVDSCENLYNAFWELTELDGGLAADDMIRLEAEGSHRIIFINKSALDYVVIPTHQFEEGRVEADAADLDA